MENIEMKRKNGKYRKDPFPANLHNNLVLNNQQRSAHCREEHETKKKLQPLWIY